MQLTINLLSPHDVAAARVLLDKMSDTDLAGFATLTHADSVADLEGKPRPTQTPRIDPADVPDAGTASPAAVTNDAAAIFGGAAPTLPAGAVPLVPPAAPSTAGAVPSPSAPVVPQAGAVAPTPGAQLPAPPIVPAANAPSAPATPSSPAGGVEVDTDGLPWDERIHAGTKTRNADGRWKAKKGINDPALVERVKAELRTRMASGVAKAPDVPALPQPPAPFAPPAASSQPAQPVAPSASASPTTFEDFVLRTTQAVRAGVLPNDSVQAACVAHNLPSVVSLQQYPDFVGHVWRYLKTQYPALA